MGIMKPDAPHPFEIWTKKFDGSQRFYMRYADRPTAELVAERLREIGLPCELRENQAAAEEAGESHASALSRSGCRPVVPCAFVDFRPVTAASFVVAHKRYAIVSLLFTRMFERIAERAGTGIKTMAYFFGHPSCAYIPNRRNFSIALYRSLGFG